MCPCTVKMIHRAPKVFRHPDDFRQQWAGRSHSPISEMVSSAQQAERARHALGKAEAGSRSMSFSFAVPDLTRNAGIQLNERVSLRRANEILSFVAVVLDWSTRPRRPCVPHD